MSAEPTPKLLGSKCHNRYEKYSKDLEGKGCGSEPGVGSLFQGAGRPYPGGAG